ncbi:hypothetical protein TNCV_2614741 [Trichonephila clavipes]|nr:hypothetical protein TNCV_2614741 [Trichonephila clavipes]
MMQDRRFPQNSTKQNKILRKKGYCVEKKILSSSSSERKVTNIKRGESGYPIEKKIGGISDLTCDSKGARRRKFLLKRRENQHPKFHPWTVAPAGVGVPTKMLQEEFTRMKWTAASVRWVVFLYRSSTPRIKS